jgi:hypothetical protein
MAGGPDHETDGLEAEIVPEPGVAACDPASRSDAAPTAATRLNSIFGARDARRSV